MSQTNGKPQRLRTITQDVIIRTLEPGANRTLRGYVQDRSGSGVTWIITTSMKLYLKEQMPAFEKELILDFSHSQREKRYKYTVVYDENGVVDEKRMSTKDLHLKNCMEAYRTMHAQIKVHGVQDIVKCKEINPNLTRPQFSIEFVGYDQVDKALTLCEQAKVFNEFFALSKQRKLECCYFYGYNPIKLEVGKEPVSPRISAVLNAMVDFKNGVLMKPDKRKDFLQVYLPMQEKHSYVSTIKAGIALNIIAWRVNAYYIKETNVGFAEPAVYSYLEQFPDMFQYVKEEVTEKQFEIEDDWSHEDAIKAFDIEAERKTNTESMALKETNRKLEEQKIREEAKQLGHKNWHNSGTEKLLEFINDKKEEEKKLATS